MTDKMRELLTEYKECLQKLTMIVVPITLDARVKELEELIAAEHQKNMESKNG